MRTTTMDPLCEKYYSTSPYAWCNNNPVNYVDPDGKDWRDSDGNEIIDQSNIKVYIFYNAEDFDSQTNAMVERLEGIYGKGTVALSDVRTNAEFAKDWENMNSLDIQEVQINHHGNNQTIMLDSEQDEYLTATGNGKTNKKGHDAINIQDLKNPTGNITNARLQLNTCHSNDRNQYPLKGTGHTLMETFYQTFSFKSVKGTKAGVSYGTLTAAPHPQSNKILGIIKVPGRNDPVWDILRR